MSRYSQPERAMRRKAADRAVSADYAAYYGDPEAQLDRVSTYLGKEWGRAISHRDLVRAEAIKGAQSVVRAALKKVLTHIEECPY